MTTNDRHFMANKDSKVGNAQFGRETMAMQNITEASNSSQNATKQ